jgi:hypothetical protein
MFGIPRNRSCATRWRISSRPVGGAYYFAPSLDALIDLASGG